MIMNVREGNERAAIVEDNELLEVMHAEDAGNVGNIYIGKIVTVLAGMQAAFVDIGTGKNAYLHLHDTAKFIQSKKKEANINRCVHEGQYILVQIVKDEVDDKGAKVTERLEFTGKYAVYMPFDGAVTASRKISDETKRAELLSLGRSLCASTDGIIFRSAANEVGINVVEDELRYIREKYVELTGALQRATKVTLLHTVASFLDYVLQLYPVEQFEEIIVDSVSYKQMIGHEHVVCYRERENVFSHYRIETQIEEAVHKVVPLKNGAYIVIEHTEAMTVIDVNTGKFVGKQHLQDTAVKTNEWAAIEVAKQLRLRNIGGMVLIDFINMKKEEDKVRVKSVMQRELRKDRTTSRVYDFTALGVLEVTRKRSGKSLRDQLQHVCQECHGSGHVRSDKETFHQLERELWEYKGTDVEAIIVEANKGFVQVVQPQMEQLKASLGYEVFIVDIASCSTTYHIRYIGSIEGAKERM
nr:Rne/Rng family ribonuclease [Priestia taiwanensis]